LEDLLGPRRERDLPGGDLLTGADDPHHLGANALDGDVKGLEHPRGQALLLAEQPEQDVLGADVVVLEGSRLFLGQDHDLARSLCESLEQLGLPLLRLKSVPPPRRFGDTHAAPFSVWLTQWSALREPAWGRKSAGASSTFSAARGRRIRPPVVVDDEHPVYRRPLGRHRGARRPISATCALISSAPY